MQTVQQRSPERFMTDTPSSRRNLVGNFQLIHYLCILFNLKHFWKYIFQNKSFFLIKIIYVARKNRANATRKNCERVSHIHTQTHRTHKENEEHAWVRDTDQEIDGERVTHTHIHTHTHTHTHIDTQSHTRAHIHTQSHTRAHISHTQCDWETQWAIICY